jgi:phospholipid-binding lipoprotein MlaA
MTTINRIIGVTLLLLSLNACNTLTVHDDISKQVSADPLEGLNRSVYAFNNAADKVVIKPVAKAYNKVLPAPAKKGVSNFFSNLGEPLNALNNLLQGKYDRALTSTYRFAVNSTVGVLGLFDVASTLDVKPAREDLGQTLASWGVGPGPYLMLPFLGPTNLRDGVGRIGDGVIFYPINEVTSSQSGRTALTVTNVVSLRAGFLGTDEMLESQLDPYAFLKRAVEQNRVEQLYDGEPPVVEEDFDF